MERESLSLAGEVTFVLKDKEGKIKDKRQVKNLITDAGFDFVCDVMGKAAQPADMSYTAIGTGTTAATDTNTELETESTRKTNAYGHTTGENTYYSTCTFGAGEGTGAITESGMLNHATTGSLLCRQTFSVINKGADDSLEVTWKITLS